MGATKGRQADADDATLAVADSDCISGQDQPCRPGRLHPINKTPFTLVWIREKKGLSVGSKIDEVGPAAVVMYRS